MNPLEEWKLRADTLAPELVLVRPELALTGPTSESVEWEIINPHDSDGQGIQRLDELHSKLLSENHEEKVHLLPYEEAMREIAEHIVFFEKNPSDEEGVVNKVVNYLMETVPGLKRSEVEALIDHQSITKDVTWLNNEFKQRGSSREIIDQNAIWLHNKETGELIKWIDEKTQEMLHKARLVGLVSFETLDKLRDAKIVVAGASASAKTVELLATLGAKNFLFVDQGIVSPAKSALYPGGMSSVSAVGTRKAIALKKNILSYNPFANIEVKVGLLKQDGESIDLGDINFSSFTDGATLVIECVDSPEIKTQLRVWMEKHRPDIPVVFLADLGNRPIAGIEWPGLGLHFHQNLSTNELATMAQKPQSLLEALSFVYQMIKGYLPLTHGLQFIYYLAGITSAWSQSAIASTEASVIATKLILKSLEGDNLLEKNYTSSDTPNTFVKRITPIHTRTLKSILTKLFKLS